MNAKDKDQFFNKRSILKDYNLNIYLEIDEIAISRIKNNNNSNSRTDTKRQNINTITHSKFASKSSINAVK